MRLHASKFGLAAGILWALCLFVMTWIALWSGYGLYWLAPWMDVYPGYMISPLGSLIGLIYGFIDGFVFAFLLAWIYNLFLKK